jgi:hypothetical protein
MLKKPASGILDTREASFVSGFGRFTNEEDGLFEHPARYFPVVINSFSVDF